MKRICDNLNSTLSANPACRQVQNARLLDRQGVVQVFCEEVRSSNGTFYRHFVAASYGALWTVYSELRPMCRHFYEVQSVPEWGTAQKRCCLGGACMEQNFSNGHLAVRCCMELPVPQGAPLMHAQNTPAADANTRLGPVKTMGNMWTMRRR